MPLSNQLHHYFIAKLHPPTVSLIAILPYTALVNTPKESQSRPHPPTLEVDALAVNLQYSHEDQNLLLHACSKRPRTA